MHSKVSSDWLSSYIKVTGPVLEIFKMAGYFPDRPCYVMYVLFNINFLSYWPSHTWPVLVSVL